MAVSFTTEQKLIFYLAQNIARLEPSFDAFKISRILVECGVFKENPLLVGERSKEATFVLLKHLFEMLSSRNDARAQQFRIFRLAVGEAGNREILEECLPDLGCSKDVRNNDVAKWLTPYTGSAEELVLFSLVVFVFLCFCVLSVKVISVEWFAAYARWFWFKAESCMWRHASNDTYRKVVAKEHLKRSFRLQQDHSR
eukprot:m.266811 g.266811  ORF g.266811 m.266811 type:complete len:198 (+) comp40505_c0_seq7:698-1291(+)